jgi:hypothetical protein
VRDAGLGECSCSQAAVQATAPGWRGPGGQGLITLCKLICLCGASMVRVYATCRGEGTTVGDGAGHLLMRVQGAETWQTL